jgi:hypothetical protein
MENGCGFSRHGWLAWMCKDDLLGAIKILIVSRGIALCLLSPVMLGSTYDLVILSTCYLAFPTQYSKSTLFPATPSD